MDRETSAYAPLTRHRLPRGPHLFKSTRLNSVGWAALAGLCLVVGAIFGGVAAAVGWSWWAFAVLGVMAALGSLLVLDRRKFSTLYSTYSWTDDEDEKAAVCADLQAAGIAAELVSWNNEPPFGVRVRNRDGKRANRVLVANGIRAAFRY